MHDGPFSSPIQKHEVVNHDMQEAVDEAAEHIEIRAHLDLTVLEMADSSDILGKINKKIKSIRVRA